MAAEPIWYGDPADAVDPFVHFTPVSPDSAACGVEVVYVANGATDPADVTCPACRFAPSDL